MVRSLLRSLATALIPGVLTFVALRYLLPTTRHPLLLAAGTFLAFSIVTRYWSTFLMRDHLAADVPATPVRGRSRTATTIGATLLAAAAAVLLRSSVGGAYEIVSTSMLPSLEPGDRPWGDKLAYGTRLPFSRKTGATRPPRRGEIVIFGAGDLLNREGPSDLVKRVIGLPGDHITMSDGHPLINGQPVPSCDAGTFVYYTADRTTRGRLALEFLDDSVYLTVQEPGTPRSFTGYDVKDGEVFVLGDNRGVSNDSRSWRDGRGAGVPLSSIEARVSRLAFAVDLNGRFDWSRIGGRVGLDVHLPEGVDVRPLEAGIARCLKNPPQPLRPASSTSH